LKRRRGRAFKPTRAAFGYYYSIWLVLLCLTTLIPTTVTSSKPLYTFQFVHLLFNQDKHEIRDIFRFIASKIKQEEEDA